MMSCMQKKNGFTMLELLIAGLAFTLVALGASNVLYFQNKSIEKAREIGQRTIDSQQVMNHIVENIESSAWIIFHDNEHIELRSHSFSKPRHYTFDDTDNLGRVIYTEGTYTPPGVLFNKDDRKHGRDLNTNQTLLALYVDGNPPTGGKIFEPVGTPRDRMGSGTDNCYESIKINVKNKSVFEGVELEESLLLSETTVPSREDSRLIFVDDRVTTLYPDGTKANPYKDLDSALNVAGPTDIIFVVWGEHELETGETYTLNARMLYFSPNSQLVCREGSTLCMGKDASIRVEGGFSAMGQEGSPVTFTSTEPTVTWRGITIDPRPDADGNIQSTFVLDYVDSNTTSFGFTFSTNGVSDLDMNVTVTNSKFDYASYRALYLYGVQNADVENNYFSWNRTSLRVSLPSWFKKTGDIVHVINNNNFGTNPDKNIKTNAPEALQNLLNYRFGIVLNDAYVESGSTITQVVMNNSIDSQYCGISTSNLQPGDGKLIRYIANNDIVQDPYTIVGQKGSGDRRDGAIFIRRERNVNPESQIWISNNKIDGNNQGCGGIWLTYNPPGSPPIYIEHNDIRDFRSEYPSAGILVLGADAIVRNNLVKGNRYWGIVINDWDHTEATLTNNVVTRPVSYYTIFPDSLRSEENILTYKNNTFLNNVNSSSHLGTLTAENCIVERTLTNHRYLPGFSYSYIDGVREWYDSTTYFKSTSVDPYVDDNGHIVNEDDYVDADGNYVDPAHRVVDHPGHGEIYRNYDIDIAYVTEDYVEPYGGTDYSAYYYDGVTPPPVYKSGSYDYFSYYNPLAATNMVRIKPHEDLNGDMHYGPDRPTYVDADGDNYALVDGSTGKGAGSDGNDIGAIYGEGNDPGLLENVDVGSNLPDNG